MTIRPWLIGGICLVGLCLGAQEVAEPPLTARLFERWRGNLVIVSVGKGEGSGFVCELNGKPYIVTCAHVLESGRTPSFRLLDGTELAWQNVEFAEEADLVRVQLRDPWQGQRHVVRSAPPRMAESVVVVGNSGGLGVATATPGEVIGIGVGVVEVTAEIAQGISGAPILDAQGQALAVASHASVPRNLTPFDLGNRSSGIRRFGLLLADRKWEEVAWADYADQARRLTGLEFLAKHDLNMLIFYSRDRQSRGKRAIDMPPYNTDRSSALSGDPSVAQSIAKLYACEGHLRKAGEELAVGKQDVERARVWRTLTEQRDAMLRECLTGIGTELATTKWVPPLRKRAAELSEAIKLLHKHAEDVATHDAALLRTLAAKAGPAKPAESTDEGAAGKPPGLIAPPPGAMLPQIEGKWVFQWEAVQGATHYELLVAHPDGLRPFLNPIIVGTTYTRHPPPRRGGYLSLTKGWTWKVRARDNRGVWGPWSPERTFDVEPRNVD